MHVDLLHFVVLDRATMAPAIGCYLILAVDRNSTFDFETKRQKDILEKKYYMSFPTRLIGAYSRLHGMWTSTTDVYGA